MGPETIPELLASRVRATPDQPAFFMLQERAWRPITWSAFAGRVEQLATALHQAGFGRGTRAAIVARTCIEWEAAQMAALRVGATVIGVDPSYPSETLAQVLESTRPELLFVEDTATLARLPGSAREGVRLAVRMRGEALDGPSTAPRLADLLERGRSAGGALPPAPAPGDTAIVVFSSGTTGSPKAIAYTHRQVLLAVGAIVDAFPDIGAGSRLACWLPLANLFQRIINLCGVARGAVSYVIEDPREIVTHLPAVSPHVFIGVPRFFEKVCSGIEDRVATAPAPARALARWALGVGQRGATVRPDNRSGLRRARTGRTLITDGAIWWLADRLVLRRLRAVCGGNVRYLISGSAPMPQPLLEWFEAIGLPVCEAYGVSENILPVAMNRPGARRLGTVGKPMPGNDVKLGPDGEVLVRGAGVFSGYLGANLPRLDAQGFWATGDIGELTPDGYLRLQGRKSDGFKTAGGRWMVPGDVEARLRQVPYVEHAVLVPSSAGVLVAILDIDLPRFRGESLSRELTLEERARIARDAGAALAAVPAYSRPGALLVVTTAFSIAGGELTTNLKPRRGFIADKFRSRLAGLREAAPTADEPGIPLVLVA